MADHKYTGSLGKNRAPRTIGLLQPDDQARAASQEWIEEDWEKILMLCDEFDVEKDQHMAWNLALALAKAHVPGFQEKRKRGRETKWTTARLGMLLVEMERVIEADGCTAIKAAEQLANRDPWQFFLEQRESGYTNSNPAEALRALFSKNRNAKFSGIFRAAFRYHQAQDSLADWDKDVIESFEDQAEMLDRKNTTS